MVLVKLPLSSTASRDELQPTTTAVAGILLAVTIIYQYFETYEKERAQQGGALF